MEQWQSFEPTNRGSTGIVKNSIMLSPCSRIMDVWGICFSTGLCQNFGPSFHADFEISEFGSFIDRRWTLDWKCRTLALEFPEQVSQDGNIPQIYFQDAHTGVSTPQPTAQLQGTHLSVGPNLSMDPYYLTVRVIVLIVVMETGLSGISSMTLILLHSHAWGKKLWIDR